MGEQDGQYTWLLQKISQFMYLTKIKNKWFTWSNNKFVEVDTPVLTENFAGIGTRNINEAGKQAIKEVYEKTIKSPITPQQKQGVQKQGNNTRDVQNTTLIDEVGRKEIEDAKNKCK